MSTSCIVSLCLIMFSKEAIIQNNRPQNNRSDIGHCPTHLRNCPTEFHNYRTKCPTQKFQYSILSHYSILIHTTKLMTFRVTLSLHVEKNEKNDKIKTFPFMASEDILLSAVTCISSSLVLETKNTMNTSLE